jgi:UDP-glucose 4-epimerase
VSGAGRPAGAVLVTGGAGFIGTHTCLELVRTGHRVVLVDSFSNSHPEALVPLGTLAGEPVSCLRGDIRDSTFLAEVFGAHRIGAVVHFAARKAVAESVELPGEYYDVNVGGTVTLLNTMLEHGVRRLVFSSSCSIYGAGDGTPLTESSPARPTNPYARSKWMCEQVIADLCVRHPDLHAVALRYFNPIGAHPSGLIGEDPLGVPNNIVPYLTQVAVGRRPALRVFGADYPTADGTCVRDYVHVVDIADGHRVALDHVGDVPGLRVFNLGTGVGVSVRELVAAFERATGRRVPVEVLGRRPGDVPALVADAGRVAATWGWRAGRSLAQMCEDAWRFQSLNPHGYPG